MCVGVWVYVWSRGTFYTKRPEKTSTKITLDLQHEGNKGAGRGQKDEQVPGLAVGACLACVRDGEVVVARQCQCGRGVSGSRWEAREWEVARHCRPL